MLKRSLTFSFLAILLALSSWVVSGLKEGTETRQTSARPKLLLILVIDQFRYDYLVRFRPYFVEGGFNLLLKGASFVDCRYDYATTITGPAHATLLTGAYPNVHGIIGNDWYDPLLHRRVNCVEDSSKRTLGAPGPGISPRNLVGSTLGDELRLGTNFQSRVFSVSLKDRSAVLTGGHTANAAYWYDSKTGRFVSSSYYMQALPSWVEYLNQHSPAQTYCGKPWQALAETPEAGGKIFSEFHPRGNEKCPDESFLGWLDGTPYMNELELKFAEQVVEKEHLGKGPETDLLAISLSVNDHVGHTFGPYSPEVADTTLRTDRYLADFLNDLDRKVGLSRIWIALSADHGVAPTPYFIKTHDLGLGMAPTGEALRKSVEQVLSRSFGQDHWVEDIDLPYVLLNREALARHGATPKKAEALAADALSRLSGVLMVVTRTDLLEGNLPKTQLGRQIYNSFNHQRAGDLFVVFEPFAVPVEVESQTTHGAPWSYDSQVPLILWGGRFKPGIYTIPCQAIDLAPTLATALGVSQPSESQGHPLTMALKD